MTSLTQEQLINWMKLTRVKNLGPKRIGDLIRIFGGIDGIVSASNEELLRSRAFREGMLLEWEKLKNAAEDNFKTVIDECKENKVQILTFLDEAYPKKLRQIPYPPLTLYLLGDLSLLQTKMVAIVGAREASEDAKRWAFEQAQELSRENVTVVSGGAIGIDYAAHTGALNLPQGRTICVLGAGFFRLFPEEHTPLFNDIKKRGLLVSEHLPNFPGSRVALIQRNRITSGLSGGLVLVASTDNGGSMVQAKMAADQRVPIYCPKLSLNLKPNDGIKYAIEKFNAKEILSVKEIVNLL